MNHIIREHTPKHCSNTIPIFVLPDATGSSDTLSLIAENLNHPVIFFRDGRLDNEEYAFECSTHELAQTYVRDIEERLEQDLSDSINMEKHSRRIPIAIIAYSGAAHLAKHIEEILVTKWPLSHVMICYIDPVASQVMKDMPRVDMAEHLLEILNKIALNYPGIFIKNKENRLKQQLAKYTIGEQIKYLMEANIYGYRSSDDYEEVDIDETISRFKRAYKVMLANHLAYLVDDSKFIVSPYAAFIATEKTIAQCRGYFIDYAHDDNLLGWTFASNNGTKAKIIRVKDADHYSVLEENNVEIASRAINNYFTDDKALRRAVRNNTFIQAASEVLTDSENSDLNELSKLITELYDKLNNKILQTKHESNSEYRLFSHKKQDIPQQPAIDVKYSSNERERPAL